MNKSLPNSMSDLTTSDRNKLFDDEDSTEEEMEENSIMDSKVLPKSDSLERFGDIPIHRKNSTKSIESPKMKAREIVVDHPLEGARSSLSDDDDAENMFSSSPKMTSTPSTTNPHTSKTSSGKRMNRLHNFIATNLDESHNENQGYYNTASTLWNHRSKLLNTFKKQVASHSGSWSFTSQQQVASSTNTTTDVIPATEKELITIDTTTTTTSPGSRSMPSISVYDSATTDPVDDGTVADNVEVDISPTEHNYQSFLHELRTKVPQVFVKKYENLTSSATTMSENQLQQATATPAGETTTTVNTAGSGSPIMLKKRSDSKTSSFAVSLSSLLHKRKSSDDVVDCDDVTSDSPQQQDDNEEKDEDEISPPLSCTELNVDDVTTTTPPPTSPSAPGDDVIAAASRENQVTVEWLMRMTCLIFIYFIIPFPPSFILVVKGFILGVVSCILFLALFRPPHLHRRVSSPGAFDVNRDIPEKIPPGLYDVTQPMKGWMNEIKNYEIESYHVSNTTSVFVTIDNNALRIQTPLKNISRRGSYKEGKILLSQVLTQRIFNLNHAQVFLQPEELVSKRIWSKKYPICVQIKTNKQQTKRTRNKTASDDSDTDSVTSHPEGEDCDDVTTLYLFGRTCRQKEEWFYKIQQAINLCRISAASGGDQAKCLESVKDEWQILDEKEDPVQTCLHKMHELNENPQKILQDYYLQMTRLLPDISNQCVPEKDDSRMTAAATEENQQSRGADRIKKRDGGRLDESDLQVSWINVLVGRIMFDFIRQTEWTSRLFTRVQKKLDKIKLPYFVSGLKLIEMNLGSSAPLIHQISLPRIDKQGIWVEAEITYHGSFQMTLETYMVLTKLGKYEQNETQEKQNKMNAIVHSEAEDSAESSEEEEGENQPTQSMTDRLVQAVVGTPSTSTKSSSNDVAGSSGSGNSASASSVTSQPQQQQPKKWVRYLDQLTKSRYFKKATENQYIRRKLETISHTPVLLTVELLQMHGVVTINIPPPPSDRIWYGFREPPEIELKAFPKVGERIISIFHVTELIEQKLKQEFIKLLVLPNMEDLQIPLLFSNRSHR